VSRAYLREHLGPGPNEILRQHFTGESVGEPKKYWFENCEAVRKVLGMEEPDNES
jgi:hypothetical protein